MKRSNHEHGTCQICGKSFPRRDLLQHKPTCPEKLIVSGFRTIPVL